MGKSVLFVTWAGGGNVNPFLGLGEQLQTDGHNVKALATDVLRDRLAVAGIGSFESSRDWLPTADEVIAVVERDQPDLIVVDYMLTSALCGAETTTIPTVALVHTLYTSLLDDGTPHPMYMAGPVAGLNETRAALDLAPIAKIGDLLAACDQVMVAAPAELDLPIDKPQNVTYVGALVESLGDQSDRWSPSGDSRVILISVGTAGDPAGEIPLLQTIFQAIEPLPVAGLATVADYLDRSELTPPENVTISSYVPHGEVLPHADLFITHGGLGSVVAALAHGVPMICLPLDREQPDNAKAVVRVGAGATADPTIPADELQALIKTMLDNPTMVRFAPEPRLAAELLEALMG